MNGQIVGNRAIFYLLLVGVFFASFQEFRPADILLTYSDIAFVLAAALIFVSRGFYISYFGSYTPAWHSFFALMIGALFVNSIFNDAETEWFTVTLQYAACYILLPMLLLGSVGGRWQTIALAFVIGVLAMEIIAFGIYQYYDGDYDKLRAIAPQFSSGTGRWGAFGGNPNRHAAIIAMTLPLLYYLRTTRVFPALGFYIGVVVLAVALVFTASNSGVFATAIGTMVFLLVGGLRVRFHHIVAGLVGVMIIVVAQPPLPTVFQSRVAPVFESGNLADAGTFSSRLSLAEEAWDFIREDPLTGVGVDQYREVSSHGLPVHNSHLLLWVEGGILALIGWIGMLGVLFTIILFSARRYRLERALAFSVLTIFLVFSMASAHMYARVWMLPVLLAIAPLLARVRR